MIPTEIRKPYLRRSGPGKVAAGSSLDAIDRRPSLRRDGGSRHTARGQRKVPCVPTAMRHKFAAVTLAAAGLGLAACSTHGARTSAQPASSANRPAMSASVAPTHPAPRPMAVVLLLAPPPCGHPSRPLAGCTPSTSSYPVRLPLLGPRTGQDFVPTIVETVMA